MKLVDKAKPPILNYICKDCHKAGYRVPLNPQDKPSFEKFRAKLMKKRKEEQQKARAVEKEKIEKEKPAIRTEEICPYCGKKFRSGLMFEYHLNRELGILPFMCSVQGRSLFSRKKYLKNLI